MFKIYGDRGGVFWQWDTKQKIIVSDDITCSEIHVSHSTSEESIPLEIYESEGMRLIDIPDELFMESGAIGVYTHVKNENTGAYTEYAEFFFIMEKAKPENYVCGTREVLDYKYLASLIGKLSELDTENKEDLVKAINETLDKCSEIDSAKLSIAIKEYFEVHPPLLPEITEEDEGKILAVVGGKWKPAGLPTYEGECEITPAINPQSIHTANRFVREDVVVNSIPYNEVSNMSNGTTVTIG